MHQGDEKNLSKQETDHTNKTMEKNRNYVPLVKSVRLFPREIEVMLQSQRLS